MGSRVSFTESIEIVLQNSIEATSFEKFLILIYPYSLQRRGRCTVTFSASVVFAVVSTVSCGTILLQQTPAQDRGGGGGGFFDNLFTNPFASAPSTPAYNVPDVAGFGMYPLWKFHKFDGLSLRPVPYGVDIGTGLPPVPSPPTYPTGFIPAPNQATPAAPQKTSKSKL